MIEEIEALAVAVDLTNGPRSMLETNSMNASDLQQEMLLQKLELQLEKNLLSLKNSSPKTPKTSAKKAKETEILKKNLMFLLLRMDKVLINFLFFSFLVSFYECSMVSLIS